MAWGHRGLRRRAARLTRALPLPPARASTPAPATPTTPTTPAAVAAPVPPRRRRARGAAEHEGPQARDGGGVGGRGGGLPLPLRLRGALADHLLLVVDVMDVVGGLGFWLFFRGGAARARIPFFLFSRCQVQPIHEESPNPASPYSHY